MRGHHELFVFISPAGGITTSCPPDVPPETIHTVPELLEFSSSRLWHITQDLAHKLCELDSEPYPKKRVTEVMENIRRTSLTDMPDIKTMEERVLRALATMRKALQESRDGKVRIGDFLMPAVDTVRAYLSFELPGIVAKEVLAVILSVQCNIPPLGPPREMPPTARADTIEHLAELTYRLLKCRQRKKVTQYFELTYLAGLYALTTGVLAYHASEAGGLSRKRQDEVDRLALNAEELFASYVPKSFVLPAFFSPRQTLNWLADGSALTQQSIAYLAESYSLHPGLRSLLEPPKFQQMTSDEVLKCYQDYSDSCESFDLWEAIKYQASPVAVRNRKVIMLQITALTIGRDMSRNINSSLENHSLL